MFKSSRYKKDQRKNAKRDSVSHDVVLKSDETSKQGSKLKKNTTNSEKEMEIQIKTDQTESRLIGY